MSTRIIILVVCATASWLAVKYIPNASAALICALLAVTFALLVVATSIKSQLANVPLVAATIAFALIFVEIACFLFTTTDGGIQIPTLFARDASLGWILTPGPHRVSKTINGHTIYDVVYGIDDKGHRITKSAETGPVFGFVGDSMTFGEGVADKDTYPQAFSDLMDGKARVVNVAVTAYSPSQVLRELQLGLYDDVLKPAKSLSMITAAWHTDRTACRVAFSEGAPRYVIRDGKVVLDGACTKPPHSAFMNFVMRTAIYRVLIEPRWGLVDHDDISTYIAIISDAAKLAKSKYGATLTVLYLRNPGYLHLTGFTDDEIMRRLRDDGVDVFDATLPHEGRGDVAIPGDRHPSPLGHRIRAKMLLDHLRQTTPTLF